MRIDPRSKLVLAMLAMAAVAITVPALSPAATKAVELKANLKGKNEVPGPGDANGNGKINLFLKAKKKRVCYVLSYSKLDGASAAHIHKGGPDVAGPIKVLLFEQNNPLPGEGEFEGCVKNVKKKLIRKIIATPEKYYVNVHNEAYPDGAIRGQL
jgi:hypothetical protein